MVVLSKWQRLLAASNKSARNTQSCRSGPCNGTATTDARHRSGFTAPMVASIAISPRATIGGSTGAADFAVTVAKGCRRPTCPKGDALFAARRSAPMTEPPPAGSFSKINGTIGTGAFSIRAPCPTVFLRVDAVRAPSSAASVIGLRRRAPCASCSGGSCPPGTRKGLVDYGDARWGVLFRPLLSEQF